MMQLPSETLAAAVVVFVVVAVAAVVVFVSVAFVEILK